MHNRSSAGFGKTENCLPAGTGLSYHNERRRQRQAEREMEAETRSGKVDMAAEDIEQALKQELNTSETE